MPHSQPPSLIPWSTVPGPRPARPGDAHDLGDATISSNALPVLWYIERRSLIGHETNYHGIESTRSQQPRWPFPSDAFELVREMTWPLERSRGTTMPRGREPRSRDSDRETDRDRKESRGPRRGSSDEDALRLREEGRSYASVARSLNLKRSNDALAAFLRALHQRPDAEKVDLISRERARLDQLEARIRDRDKDDPTRLDRRLIALEKLRSSLS